VGFGPVEGPSEGLIKESVWWPLLLVGAASWSPLLLVTGALALGLLGGSSASVLSILAVGLGPVEGPSDGSIKKSITHGSPIKSSINWSSLLSGGGADAGEVGTSSSRSVWSIVAVEFGLVEGPREEEAKKSLSAEVPASSGS
jgi:hypothetical protein